MHLLGLRSAAGIAGHVDSMDVLYPNAEQVQGILSRTAYLKQPWLWPGTDTHSKSAEDT